MQDRSAAVPSVEQLAGGVRMHGVADRAMTRRLGYAQSASTRWIWWWLTPILVLGPAMIGLFEGYPEGFSLVGDLLGPIIVGAIVLGSFVVGVLFLTGPDYWQFHKLQPGTPVYVDAVPGWVGIGWREKYTALAHSHIERVSQHKSVLAVSGCETTIYIPSELIPTETASALLAKAERRNETGMDALGATTAPPRAPFLPAPGDPGNDEVIRTHATADRALADRLARSVRQSSALRKTILLALILPIAGVVALFLDSERHLVDSMFLPLVGTGAAVFCILGYFAFIGSPARLRRLVPEGTALAAEFAPDSISVRLGGCVQAFGSARIGKIERVDSALVLTVLGAAKERRRARWSGEGLLIPDELVPPHVADDLLARYG